MVSASTPGAQLAAPLSRQMTWWVLILPVAFLIALAIHSYYLLDYAHVLSGALWTGADLFLGFVFGPIMRRLTPDQRKGVISYLVPRTLLYMPVVAATTGTAGWFLSSQAGFLAATSPMRPWILVALVVTGILAIVGLGVFLPNNLRIWRELRKAQPDVERITSLNRFNNRLAGVQGVMQVAIILVMAHLTVG